MSKVEVEEAVLATEAEWARRAVSSRVRRLTCVYVSPWSRAEGVGTRLTTASCSFSSSRWSSAGVMGRG